MGGSCFGGFGGGSCFGGFGGGLHRWRHLLIFLLVIATIFVFATGFIGF